MWNLGRRQIFSRGTTTPVQVERLQRACSGCGRQNAQLSMNPQPETSGPSFCLVTNGGTTSSGNLRERNIFEAIFVSSTLGKGKDITFPDRPLPEESRPYQIDSGGPNSYKTNHMPRDGFFFLSPHKIWVLWVVKSLSRSSQLTSKYPHLFYVHFAIFLYSNWHIGQCQSQGKSHGKL